MDEASLETIEQEVTTFIRRIVISEKQERRLERSAYVILKELSTNGPAGVKTLADRLDLDISTVSRQASALLKKNYIDKQDDPNDGRAYFYQITNIGKKELEESKQIRYKKLKESLRDWSEEDKQNFAHLLKKYNQTINKKTDH